MWIFVQVGKALMKPRWALNIDFFVRAGYIV